MTKDLVARYNAEKVCFVQPNISSSKGFIALQIFEYLKQILKFENLFAKHCLNHHSQVYPDAASAETDLQTPSNRRRRRRDVIEYSRTAHGLNASHVRIRRDESDALGV